MVCNDPADAGAVVADLSDAALRLLIGHVSREVDENSITGEVLGAALVVAAARWVKGKENP